MNAVVAKKPRAKKSAKAAKGKVSKRLAPTGYALKDGRKVQMVPWIAQTPAPWRNGYARVFIPFTDAELRNARPGGVRGHEQVVHSSKLVRV